MLKTRLIPCLDVKDGRVVKGVNFVDLRDAGDPVEQARLYDAQGADELCFLDISASHEGRGTLYRMVERVAEVCSLPFTVGGGVREVADIRRLLLAGADKVSINTAAVHRPEFVAEAAEKFGSQCIVVAIDAKTVPRTCDSDSNHDYGVGGTLLPPPQSSPWKGEEEVSAPHPRCRDNVANGVGARAPGASDSEPSNTSHFQIFTHGGRNPTGIDAVAWAQKMVALGAGEILLTSMDRDGTGEGFNLPMTRAVADAVSVPVIASGGVGKLEHFAEGVTQGHASALLAASVFHFGTFRIHEVKQAMHDAGIAVRLGV